jgi:glycosyltransferase involved in cell wall biosynthesis
LEVLFVHPNFPGQFRRVAAAFTRMPGIKVFGVGDQSWIADIAPVADVELIAYPAPAKTAEELHPYTRSFNEAVRRGEQVVTTLTQYKLKGLEPDVIFTHPGWGDALFLRDIFPGAKVVGLFEYYYHARGGDLGFDPEYPSKLNDIFRLRVLNATQLMALDCCDVGICPTQWQRSRFPAVWQNWLSVLHEGIDTDRVKPDPAMTLTLEDGTVLRAGDEVLTYVSRNLEPYRGFHVFMRALPTILAARPNCHVVIAGAWEQGYGPAAAEGTSYREQLLDEIRGRIDQSRVHFTGTLGYDNYVKLLQVSRLHVYLSYPFILSWSMLEAMSAGCLVLGSATAPVEEVLVEGENGLLFPFHSTSTLAARAIEALANPDAYASLRQQARQTIIDQYDFATVALPAYQRLLHT